MSQHSNIIRDEPTTKRRKVRRGTQSCWECKRRKVRCLFSVPTNTICDNCVRRKTKCISQEYDDEKDTDSPMKRKELGTETRLSRVEDALQHLLPRAELTPQHISAAPAEHIRLADRRERGVSGHVRRQQHREDIISPRGSEDDATVAHTEAMLAASRIVQPSYSPLDRRYSGLAKELLQAWPSEADMVHIYALPISYSTHSHMNLCTPSSARSYQQLVSTQKLLRLPPPGSHPVLIARKLLFLGSLLQGAVSTPNTPDSMRERFGGIMTQAIDTATRFVTTNETLVVSVEGLECIMLEAMIHNYTGNMHRAWMAVRRASAIAQTLGLHRGIKSPILNILDPETKVGFDPDSFCFRIVEMDCYLSVILGLPRSSLEARSLTCEDLANCEPMDRMARLQCKIAERILAYNDRIYAERSMEDLKEVETLLQRAANEMTPQWWLMPDLTPGNHDRAPDSFYNIARINYQFSHYHLLMRLHLPYMVRYPKHAHSKLAAASASRETLSRYLSYRRWNPGHFYCRGVDYIAFIAMAVLCLAHIDSPTTARSGVQSRLDGSALLAQSHLGDRGLMECTVEILQTMENDTTASNLAQIMQHLLDTEASSAEGAEYDAVAEEEVEGSTDCGGKLEKENGTLKLRIPYFGTVVIRHKPDVRRAGAAMQPQSYEPSLSGGNHDLLDQQSLGQWDYQYLQQSGPFHNQFDVNGDNTGGANEINDMLDFDIPSDRTLKSINESLFGSLFGNIEDGSAPYGIETFLPTNFEA